MGATVFQEAWELEPKRVIVKVGTSSLTDESGRLAPDRIEKLVQQIAEQAHAGREMLLVTSGAIGAGMSRLGVKERPRTIPEKQAMAAIGQGLLMEVYEKLFQAHGLTVAQVLLTRGDVASRSRYLNSRNTLLKLLEYGVVPIINENDTVAVDEIRFGENDTLAALVATVVDAQLVILLSDVDGLYSADPRLDPQAKLLPVVDEITPELEAIAGGPGTGRGSGGMQTKLQAAKVAMRAGLQLVVARADRPGVVADVCAGRPVGTRFTPRERLGQRKRWLAFHGRPNGAIQVDEGAGRALREGGKSLLPAGITAVHGQFSEGELVRVLDGSGRELARGIVNYNASDIARIQGARTAEIALRLGYKDYDEIIHRDNLVLS